MSEIWPLTENLLSFSHPIFSNGLAAINLTLNGSDDRAALKEQSRLEKFGVWRETDILPRNIGTVLPSMLGWRPAKGEIHPGEMN